MILLRSLFVKFFSSYNSCCPFMPLATNLITINIRKLGLLTVNRFIVIFLLVDFSFHIIDTLSKDFLQLSLRLNFFCNLCFNVSDVLFLTLKVLLHPWNRFFVEQNLFGYVWNHRACCSCILVELSQRVMTKNHISLWYSASLWPLVQVSYNYSSCMRPSESVFLSLLLSCSYSFIMQTKIAYSLIYTENSPSILALL